MSPDVASAAAAAWQCLADSCLEHDHEHERRALDELARLGQLVPAARTPRGACSLADDLALVASAALVAARLLAASSTAADQIGDLVIALHDAARSLEPHDPTRAAELRGFADQAASQRRVLRARALGDYGVAETVPPPAALQAAVGDDLPHCIDERSSR